MALTLSLDQAFSKANKFIKKGEIESALGIYKSVLQKFPKNFRALKAIKSLRLNNFDTLSLQEIHRY